MKIRAKTIVLNGTLPGGFRRVELPARIEEVILKIPRAIGAL